MISIVNGGSAWESNPYVAIISPVILRYYKTRNGASPLFRHQKGMVSAMSVVSPSSFCIHYFTCSSVVLMLLC